jgi:Zn-dependent peptidase ImmA (M78 family)
MTAGATDAGVSLKTASDVGPHFVASDLARDFDVSTEVIMRRIEKDGLLTLC